MAIRNRHETGKDFAESKLHKWRSLILIAVVFVAVLTGLLLYKHVRVRIELARIRAAGEPVTPDDLARMYAVPEGENDTTELWRTAVRSLEAQAMRHRQTSSFDGVPFVSDAPEPPLPGDPWDDQDAAITLLKDFDQCFRELSAAADTKGVQSFLSSFDEGHNILLPHVQNLHWASRLLRLQARVRAHQGDAAGAARSIDAIYSVGQALSREPLAVTHLARLASDARAREEIERLLPFVDFEDADLARFQKRLRAADYEAGLYRAMLGERVVGLATLRNPRASGVSATQGIAYRLFGGEDLLEYLQVRRALVEVAKSEWPIALHSAWEIDRSTQIPKTENQGGGTIWSWFNPTFTAWGVASAWGSLSHPFERTARAMALNRAADAAIAVERFRRRHGRLPKHLQELVPDFLPSVPDDPFTGEPIRYAGEEHRFAAYSVGVNGIDDGGRADEIDVEHPLFGDTEAHPADYVFRVRRIPVPDGGDTPRKGVMPMQRPRPSLRSGRATPSD